GASLWHHGPKQPVTAAVGGVCRPGVLHAPEPAPPRATRARDRGGALSGDLISFAGVSKFYGEVLGVNKVDLEIAPGITSLVGPNGSGKTTLMNLATGLLRPTRGTVRVLGVSPDDPEAMFRLVGYCTQWDSFPRGLNGLEFVTLYLRLHGHAKADARRLAEESIERVGMT